MKHGRIGNPSYKRRFGGENKLPQIFLYSSLSMPYSAILVVMQRRDKRQILTQRLTLPCAFFRALRMYWCSSCADASRSTSNSGLDRSTCKDADSENDGGTSRSGGRFSTWITSPYDVTQARSMAFSSSRTLPGQRYFSSTSIACGDTCFSFWPAGVYC